MRKLLLPAVIVCSICSASSAFAVDCKALSSYQVNQTSFKDLTLREAVKTLTAGTPLQVVGDEGVRISAANVQGSMDVVLNYLAFKTGASFMRENCTLHVKAPVAPSAMSVEVLGGKGVADGAPAAAPVPTVVSSAPPAPPAAPVDPVKTWRVLLSDKSLNNTFTRWANEANWTLIWDVRIGEDIIEYEINAEAAIDGTFEEVVDAVVASLQSSEFPPVVSFSRGNRVIRVLARGDASN